MKLPHSNPGQYHFIMSLTIAALLLTFSFAACDEIVQSSDIQMEQSYEIVSGACGTVELQERISLNLLGSVKILEDKWSEYYSSGCPDEFCKEISIELSEIEVTDSENIPPSLPFYAVRVIDNSNGLIVHGVSEVVTFNGYLYQINWCPD